MIVTFYSFKGGVGRSMALANVGEFLADMGYRVIVSDWDLEAPGLERYLWAHDPRSHPYRKEEDPLLAQPGLIELLEEYKENLADSDSAEDDDAGSADDFAMLGTLRLRRPSSRLVPVSAQMTRPGSLRLLTAGRRDGEFQKRYAASIRRFDWQEFYDRWAGDSWIEFFRRDLVGDLKNDVRGAADVLLIDSRTGVTEHGGVGTHHLADVVMVMTAANDLNMDGTRWMVEALLDPRLTELRGGRKLRVIPVASRIEQNAQREELFDFRRRFLAAFKDTLNESVGDAEEFALGSEIKYMPFYSFYERVVAREPEEDREPELAASYRAIAEGIVRCGVDAGLLREPTSQGIVARVNVSAAPPMAVTPEWDHEKFLADLIAAVDALDKGRAAELIEDLGEHLRGTEDVYPHKEAAEILRNLRRKQYFDLVQLAAEKLMEYGQNAPRIRLLYAQSLIEQENLAAARTTLQALLSDTKSDSPENAEARGLLARVYEEQYLDSPDLSSSRSRQSLERAVNTYYEVYQSNPIVFSWQGIKTVALVQRARRDGIELESAPDEIALARTILGNFTEERVSSEWVVAIAIEASLALQEYQPALQWLQRYLAAPANDAYQLAALHDDLRYVWQLDLASEPGASLLPPLRAAILQRGGQLDLESGDALAPVSDDLLRSVLGAETVKSVHWYRAGLERCQAVVRIESSTGTPAATGFLLRGSDLHPSLEDDVLLVTCAYVVSNDPAARNSLRTYEAVVVLESRPEPMAVAEVLFISPQLDTAILRLDRRLTGIPAYPISAAPIEIGRRISLIGYAGGDQLSMASSTILDYEDPLIHYRLPTLRAGIGSPLFDEDWRLIGMHHAGGANIRRLHAQGTYSANEGIPIGTVIHLLQAVLPPPRAKSRPGKPPPRKKPVKRTSRAKPSRRA